MNVQLLTEALSASASADLGFSRASTTARSPGRGAFIVRQRPRGVRSSIPRFPPPPPPLPRENETVSVRFRKAVCTHSFCMVSMTAGRSGDVRPRLSLLGLSRTIRSRIGCRGRGLNGTGTASRAYYLIEEPAVGARPVHSVAT